MQPGCARSKWMLALGVFGACLFVWGLRTWEPLHVVVYRADVQHGSGNRDYRIAISNKLYHARQVLVRVTGLAAADYHLEAAQVSLPAAGHESVILSLSDKLPAGLHAFAVDVTAGLACSLSGTASFGDSGGIAFNDEDNPTPALETVDSQWGSRTPITLDINQRGSQIQTRPGRLGTGRENAGIAEARAVLVLCGRPGGAPVESA